MYNVYIVICCVCCLFWVNDNIDSLPLVPRYYRCRVLRERPYPPMMWVASATAGDDDGHDLDGDDDAPTRPRAWGRDRHHGSQMCVLCILIYNYIWF